MASITDFQLEPSVVNINQTFRAKLKVDDIYGFKRLFITENGIKLITEDGKYIRTEWDDNE